MQPEEIQQEAKKIAEVLGESDEGPVGQIAQVIEKCGLEFAQKITEETNKIEEKGGMKTHDGKRRRTKGGVFFFLVKGRIDADIRKEIFPNFGKHSNGDVAPPGIKWAERLQYFEKLRESPGQVNNLTVTLIGRPGEIHTENGSIMTVIEQKEVKAPPYPKGVPDFEEVEKTTYYNVFMSLRHWERVAESLEDETDMLIIEGTAIFDPELDGISILTTSTTTKLLERQKRLAAAQEEHDKKAEKQKKGKPANNKSDKKAVKPKASTPPKELDNVPTSVADKLKQLHSAADTLRQKIANMEEKGQKTGLNMTRRLLEQTEKQIASLEKQYES